ncbi:peptide MFS transporter [Campylobacter suis]|uniref:Dipeptide and tripeptide permease B n=1 Tax=Campylobacter suis TaxID=2790657 RepID=A0ABN7K3X9_9BACT|nr:oligopeptide:H+ symporter [Campylobacter suis]CAD7286211.1 Dipeptide and tripeptide permease B [Campylobacter suis]
MGQIWTLFATEMWEKFTFYGLRAIFSLFLVHFLGLSEVDAALYYGAFLAFSYLVPIAGGVLADKKLGYHKSIVIGALMLALSQLAFFASASGVFSRDMAILGAILTSLGNGFFKPSITALLSLRAPRGSSIDAIFSNYYFFLNLGVLLGSFLVPFFGDSLSDGVRDISAFKWGFAATFIVMSFGLGFYIFIAKPSEGENVKSKHYFSLNLNALWLCLLVFSVVFALTSSFGGSGFIKSAFYPVIYALGVALMCYVFLEKSLKKDEKNAVLRIFISSFFIVFFLATFEQTGTSLTFIANNQMNRKILNYEMPASMVSMFNPFFVIILSVPFSLLWQYLDRKNIALNNLKIQSYGLLLLAFGYLFIAQNVLNLGSQSISIWLFVGLYFIQTCAEMMVLPIGFSLVAKSAPRRFLGLIFGVFYLAIAAGYALSGTLATLLPPTADKFVKAQNLGINLSDVLSNGASQDVIEILVKNALPVKFPEILGFQIINLSDFFMIFFILCLMAGALLFGLSCIKFSDKG